MITASDSLAAITVEPAVGAPSTPNTKPDSDAIKDMQREIDAIKEKATAGNSDAEDTSKPVADDSSGTSTDGDRTVPSMQPGEESGTNAFPDRISRGPDRGDTIGGIFPPPTEEPPKLSGGGDSAVTSMQPGEESGIDPSRYRLFATPALDNLFGDLDQRVAELLKRQTSEISSLADLFSDDQA